MSIFSDAKVSRLTLVAALGYFVDIYDLLLFNVIKTTSLKELGLDISYEASLANWQMFGMLIGGIFWGILGDKKGRITVLFGSIITYSIANLANAFVTNYEMYAVWRFIAGLGLAGELGAGVTLVSETMDKENRGIGTMVIVSFGVLGAVVAALVSQWLGWKLSFIVGGVLGLLLLLLRAGALESGMFEQVKQAGNMNRGNMLQLINNGSRFSKYLKCILLGMPIWYIIGILIAFSNRFGVMNQVQGTVAVATSVMFCYLGLSAGDVVSGLLSQIMRSRKKVILMFLSLMVVVVGIYLFSTGLSLPIFYTLCFLLGFSAGYWALFVQNASEQFGTNIRSTVTNTVPNFVRGGLVLMTFVFMKFVPDQKVFDGHYLTAALVTGGIFITIAIVSTLLIEETFGKDLDYVEE